jgi:HEAT repeat protein
LAELKRLPSDPGRAFAFQKRVFDLVTYLNDPGAANALAEFLAQKQHPYFETRAATALAALGDLRAVPFLARRLRLDPLEVYSDDVDWELGLKRDDNERVVSARLLADLAWLHPEARASILAQSEDALWFWLNEMPSPHANGLRALAQLKSTKHLKELRAWSSPRVALPREGQQPPMPDEWVIAQVALRYVGKLQDSASFPVLLKMLQRRPQGRDVTMEGLMSGGIAILGLSLRAIGIGAADGLSEWGDARAYQPLLAYVDDALNNEQSRLSACMALGWAGTDKDLERLAQRAVTGGTSPTAIFRRLCYLEGLAARPVATVPALLLPVLNPREPEQLRQAAARALGRNGLDAATEAKLIALLDDTDVKTAAALALLLGGSAKSAVAVVQSYARNATPPIDELQTAYARATSGVVSTDDVANGTLFRYVENAEAVASELVHERPQDWATRQLGLSLEQLVFDNGPHSATRVILNDQLRRVARGADLRHTELALSTLGLLHETGHLLDFSRGTGPTADSARKRLRALLAADAAKRPAEAL